MPYPMMLHVQQRFEAPRVADLPAAVRAELARIGLPDRIRPGQSVAVAVGSRGITGLPVIVRTLVDCLRAVGTAPFIVPAMGSHGGATAEGQERVLAGYGITGETMGAPVRATMEVVELGTTDDGVPVCWNRHAYEADHVVAVNRIKPHTGFAGPIESGLVKMIMIGLGNHVGAARVHRASVDVPWDRLVRTVGPALLARCRVACGLAIVENARDEVAALEAIPGDAILAREPALLELARHHMPHLPVARAHLLIVDEMGKNISGLGMDTTIIGRKPGVTSAFQAARVFVRDLTPESHGNAHGLGLADFTTARLVRAMDRRTTTVNALAAVHPAGAMIPIHFETDREAIDAALATVGLVRPVDARIVRIRNTLALAEIEVSEACRDELAARSDVRVLEPACPLAFDAAGNLLPCGAGATARPGT